jgi:DNA-binding transcriptional LysR family regulator
MSYLTARQLQVFVEAAETLSFVRVAERLRLTPSAVSFQIRQIEGQTEFALFERIGRKVALTSAGRVLLEYARPVLRGLSDLDQAMLALKGVGEGRVTLGLVSTAKYIVPHMIARFRRHHPGISVLLRDGNRRQIQAGIAAGAMDLAVMGQPQEGAEITGHRFADHPSVIIGPPGHPLETERDVPPAALASEWFVMREEGAGTRSLADAFFAASGFTPRIAMETSSNEMIKQAVMARMGIALLSRHTISLERSLGLLSILPVAGFPVLRSWYVVHRRTSPLLPAHTALRDYLVENGQSIIDEVAYSPQVAIT